MWIDYSVMEKLLSGSVMPESCVGRSQPAADISMYVLGPIYITFLPPSGYLKKYKPLYLIKYPNVYHSGAIGIYRANVVSFGLHLLYFPIL